MPTLLRWLHRLLAGLVRRDAGAPKPVVEELEPRILYSADANPLLWAGQAPNATAIVAPIDTGQVREHAQLVDAQRQQRRHEIVFVDAAVPDSQQLIDGLLAQRGTNADIEIVQLRDDADGLAQITNVLSGERHLDAIHIISHGDPGQLTLGNGSIDAQALRDHGELLAAWRGALTDEADILLYGCNVAEGAAGQAFVAQLASVTGADVAASTDLTGQRRLGGNWTLEYRVGTIETSTAIGEAAQQDWAHSLAVAIDATSTGTSAGASLSISHTTAGSNRLMLVGVSMNTAGANSVSAMTYNGASLSLVGTRTDGVARIEIWSLVAPTVGTSNLNISISGTSDGVTAGVMTFTGVDQASALGSFASNSGIGASGSVTVGSAVGELVFGAIAVDDAANYDLINGQPGQAEHWDLKGGANINGGGSTMAGAASVGLSWAWPGNDTWAAGGVAVKPVLNTAPVLDSNKSPVLTAINEDAGTPSGALGTLVSSLVDFSTPSGQVDNVTDAGASLGIAITAADTTNGSWYYSTNNGTNWNALGAVTDSNARLVAADASTRLYFQPVANYSGTLASAITFRAWDQTSGSNGALAGTAPNGGSSAFSAATDTASLTVSSANDAPVLHAWYDPAWSSRKNVTVDSNQVQGDLTGFPLLVTLSADTQLVAFAQADGDDILFTSADGRTKLAHEIHSYNPATGALTVWIKTDLSASVDTKIFMYYGNAAAASQQDAANVWSAGYVGVWHLDGTPTGVSGDVRDSTAYANHGTTQGGMTATDSVTAVIGKGLDFDEVNNLIRVSDSASLDSLNDAATFSLWVWYDNAADGDSQLIMSSSNRYSGLDGYEWASQSGGNHFFYPDATLVDGNYNIGLNPFANRQWHHLAVTLDFATKDVDIYVDGAAMAFTSEGVPLNWTSLTSSNDWLWGGNPDRPTRYFDGLMDEIRVSDVVRSQAWIQTERTNQSSPATFVSISTAQGRDQTLTLTPVTEDAVSPTGQTVATVVGSQFADIDAGSSMSGIAVVGNTANAITQGSWQYSTDSGSNWFAIGTVADGATALALSSSTLIRFVPVADYNGAPPALGVRGLDNTYVAGYSSTAGSQTRVNGNTTSNGGTTAIAAATANLSTSITAVNDAPVRTAGLPSAINVGEDSANSTAVALGLGSLAYGPGGGADEAGQTLSYKVTVIPSHITLWLADGTTPVLVNDTLTLTQLQGLKCKTVAQASGSANLSWDVQDNAGTANGGVDTLTENLAITVNAVADTPSISNTTTNEDTRSSTGLVITRNVADGAQVTHFKVTGISNGTLFQNNGTTPINNGDFITFAQGNAGLKFTPAADFNGSGSFTIRASTSNNDAGLGGSAVNASINVNAVNDAPAASGSATLAPINEDTAAPAGATVSLLFSANFSDAKDQVSGGSSANTFAGIAISSYTVNAARGQWQYSTNAGGSWTTLASASSTTAITLNAADLLRFVPTPNHAGAATAIAANLIESGAAITSGATLNLSAATGGATRISAATVSLSNTVTAVNDAPVVTTSGGALAYTENAAATAVDTGLTVGDIDSTNLTGATVSISANYASGQDVLAFTNQLGITGSWNAGTGVLTLSGTTTLANYQTALRSVTYFNSSHNPSTLARTVSFVGNDAALPSAAATRTINVTAVNDVRTGAPVVTGTATEDQTLTANTTSIADADGLGAFNYQWRRNGVNVAGATGSTYVLGDADVGRNIRVVVSYTDGGSSAESATSAAVGPVANVNDAPTGAPVVVGTATEGQTLSVNTSSIADADGLGSLSYQWQRNGFTIAGATGATYTPGDADVGNHIRVVVAYTDAKGTAESLTSAAVGPVDNINDAPTGSPVVTGTPSQGQVLAADTTTIADADGLGAFSYRWQRNGSDIAGATASTYTLAAADVGTSIRVVVSYADGHGAAESLTSSAVGPVTAVNSAPTGAPVVTGSPAEDQALSVDTAGLADADGLGTFSYRWQRNGANILGATASTYTLDDADVGTNIRVIVSYIDGGGTAESVSSAAVGPVANINDAPVAADDRPSLSFDGIDDYVSVPNSASLTMGSTMTLEAWINPDISTRSVQMIANKEGEYELSIFADGSLNFAIAEGGNWNWHNTGATIARNVWTHVAITYNAGVVTTYVNGMTVDSQSMATSTIDDVYPALNELRIGGRSNNPANQYFDGRIADVRVWNVARSGADIAGAMNSTLTGSETGLAAYLPLNDNVGLNASDETANGNNGTLVNGAAWSGYRINEDTVLNATAPGVLGTDYDADGDTLTAVLVSGTANGSLTLNANGSFVYTPDANWHGTDSFTYRAFDGIVYSNTASVTIVVDSVSDAPTGAPVITGAPTEDQTLSADTSAIADGDGLGAFSYQWERDGVDIAGAVGGTYVLGDIDVGASIRIIVSYTDAEGTAESLTSAAVGPVANVNDVPTGMPVVTGAATEDQTLGVDTSSIADADGLGAFSYQWQRNGVNVGGAISGTYVLGDVDVGANIRVVVTYPDGNGTAESLTSAAVGSIANVNDAPSGAPVVTGTTIEDQTLSADTSIADADGLGAFSYQWQRNAVAIAGATASTYTLGDADVGADIGVVVSYTDAHGTVESPTSAAVGPIANVNDAPGGTPVVSGSAIEDQTLSADTSSIADADGLGPFGYQWQRNGVDIAGATGSAYLLGDTDVGANIRVVVSDTDARGTAESLTSAAVGPIANVNDAPSGTPLVTGAAIEDQTLNVDTSSIADADGLGAFGYQWQRNGVNIAGATAATYTLDHADVGASVRVVVSYTDDQGTAESLTSAAVGPIANINDAPVVTSDGGNATAAIGVAENQTSVTTVTSSDIDGGAPAYTIVGGADAARFTIDPTSGVLRFVAAPDFEAASDFDGDNVYEVMVQVADGNGGFDTQALAVTVADSNDAPVIVSDGGSDTASVIVAENQNAVTTVVSSDVDGAAPVFSVVGGADAALFAIDTASGVLRFIGAKDFEAPADADRDDVYHVTVQVADGNGGFDTQAIAVRVTDVNEVPAITSLGGGAAAGIALAENQAVVAIMTATDPEGDTLRWRIVGGSDAARFAIDAANGALRFVAAPDFEAPADADADNVYELAIGVDDGRGGSDWQAISVAVNGINEVPLLAMPAAVDLGENAAAGTLVARVTASDPDAGDLFSFTLVGDGGGRFMLDAASGQLLVAPGATLDFEASSSHTLLLRVTDAQGMRTEQAIVVTLRDMPEGEGLPLPDMTPPPALLPAPAPGLLPEALPSLPEMPPIENREFAGSRDVRAPSDEARRGALLADALNGQGNDSARAENLLQRERMQRDGAALPVASVSFVVPGMSGGDWSAQSLDELLLQATSDSAGARPAWPLLRGSVLDTGPVDGGERTGRDEPSQHVMTALQDPVRVASATLTAGFVWWLTRSGGLLTSILMGIPAWRHVDLLPVLAPRPDEEDGDEDPTGEDTASERHGPVDELFSNTARFFGESNHQ